MFRGYKMWEKLEKVNIKNKGRYLILFRELIDKINQGNYIPINEEKEDYYIVTEKRKGENFVHIVPKEVKSLFEEMREEAPNEFLGFTVLVDNIRVSCFGIPCSELSKIIINKD